MKEWLIARIARVDLDVVRACRFRIAVAVAARLSSRSSVDVAGGRRGRSCWRSGRACLSPLVLDRGCRRSTMSFSAAIVSWPGVVAAGRRRCRSPRSVRVGRGEGRVGAGAGAARDVDDAVGGDRARVEDGAAGVAGRAGFDARLTVMLSPLRQIFTCCSKRNWGSAIVFSCELVAGGSARPSWSGKVPVKLGVAVAVRAGVEVIVAGRVPAFRRGADLDRVARRAPEGRFVADHQGVVGVQRAR